MDITSLLTGPQPKDKMNWGEALSLWNIGRFKIIGLTVTEFFLAQAKDVELKKSLELGVEMLIIPHIEKIQGFMHKEGLEVPAVPQRKNLDIIGNNDEPNTYIQDDEIANTVKDVYKFGLSLDMNGLSESTRDDVREIIWEILSDDYKGYDAMIKLHRKKNWLIPPPTV